MRKRCSSHFSGEFIYTEWRWYKIKSGHWWRWYIWRNENNFGIQTPFGLLHRYKLITK